MEGLKIWVSGIVQGVGFRPFVYAQAIRYQLTGWVRNTSAGVEIEINGESTQIQLFLNELNNHIPPLARIDSLVSQKVEADHYAGFAILESQPEPGRFLPVSPDTSICPDCLSELFDPANRRFRYPFINCTNCGPRFTIIQDIPYDRPKTTMSSFEMCPDCKSEYENPLDRRFHAQPVACPRCGPQLWFESKGERLSEREDAVQTARDWLRQGKIIAVKGLGGFHLACDASNPQAVAELRLRKKRSQKPFALMAFDLATIEQHCRISPDEKGLLLSSQHPILLLDRKPNSSLPVEIAPNQATLGMMLPYTPLHFLLLEPKDNFPKVFVMTSGNLSEEPIVYRNEEIQRLDTLADGFLMHDRPIHIRTDDSVIRVINHASYPIRRSRGYAPDPILLQNKAPSILATGSELKNTFCLTRDQYAFISHHIGDMENYETFQSFEEGITHFQNLFRIKPEIIACDLHPDYLATRYAEQRAADETLPLVKVQHHHAHLAACLADNKWNSDEYVTGLSFDGTGMGTDGTIWGGEVLLGNFRDFQRVYHLKPVPLPGGDLSVRKPVRMALSHLWSAQMEWDPSLPPVAQMCAQDQTALKTQIEHGINTPMTSSMGRLFDAVSALLGLCFNATYEGQAAIELENIADPDENSFYNFEIDGKMLDPRPLFESILLDWYNRLSIPVISARFHNSLVNLALLLCQDIRKTTGVNTVALSGGVWQNRLLFVRTIAILQKNAFRVLTHKQVPANDGGISLGQAMVAAKTA
jgi:hydrogenase maturation protein HypF